MIYILSFVCTFVAVFLKGFQHKNVIHGHIKAVCVTAYLMYLFDILAVALIIKNDWTIVFISAFGASASMYYSIKLHDNLHAKGKLK